MANWQRNLWLENAKLRRAWKVRKLEASVGGEYISYYFNSDIIIILPLLTTLPLKKSPTNRKNIIYFPSWLKCVAAVLSGFVLGGSSIFNEPQSVGKLAGFQFAAAMGPGRFIVTNEKSRWHFKFGHPQKCRTNSLLPSCSFKLVLKSLRLWEKLRM